MDAPGGTLAGVFERLTDGARKVVVLAQEEATALGHSYIGTEHLLLGLLGEEDGTAARALERVANVTADDVRADVERIVGRGQESAAGQIPFTPRAKAVLELALGEANALRHDGIGSEHILLGLAHENRGVAAKILAEHGADPDRVRDAVAEALSVPRASLDVGEPVGHVIAVRASVPVAGAVGFVLGFLAGRRSGRQ